ARALLFPIDWPEPFGLVMIEALACGTPVVAWRQGSVPEVVTDGVTGFVVDSVEEAVRAVGRVGGLSRRDCRRGRWGRFDARGQARGYLEVYRRLARGEDERAGAGAGPIARTPSGGRGPLRGARWPAGAPPLGFGPGAVRDDW